MYIEFARILAETDDIIFDERSLPFSKRFIKASIITTIERLIDGIWDPIHALGGKERELDHLRTLLLHLESYVKIDQEDVEMVIKINKIGKQYFEDDCPYNKMEVYQKMHHKYLKRGMEK